MLQSTGSQRVRRDLVAGPPQQSHSQSLSLHDLGTPKRVCAHLVSRVQLLATPWTAACQAPPPMEFSSKNTGVGCHFLLQALSEAHLLIKLTLEEQNSRIRVLHNLCITSQSALCICGSALRIKTSTDCVLL